RCDAPVPGRCRLELSEARGWCRTTARDGGGYIADLREAWAAAAAFLAAARSLVARPASALFHAFSSRFFLSASVESGMAPLPMPLHGFSSFASKPLPFGPTRQLTV